jgi:hypothetical protein
MSPPSAKDLKKLADACRKAGIKHFKQGDLEFTLSDDAPVSNYKKSKATKQPTSADAIDANFQSDDLTEEQLLMWSVADPLTDLNGSSEEGPAQ